MRLSLRKGFKLQAVPGGGGQLTDTKTGDALVVPVDDYAVLSSEADEGLDALRPQVAEVLNRYRPFYVEAVPLASFYELDIEDAPTAVGIPSIAPVTLPAAEQEQELQLNDAMAAAAADEPVTREHAPFQAPAPAALPPDEAFTQPEAQQPAENLSPEPAPEPAPLTPSEVEGPAPEAAPRSSRKPLVLTLLAVTLLGVGVGVTWILRPGGEFFPETPTGLNPTTVVPPSLPFVDAGEAEPELIDAGLAEAVVDAGAIDSGMAEAVDAGADEPIAPSVIDAGAVAVIAPEPIVDAGAAEVVEDDGSWLTGEVQSRGRVKMGEVLATASGVLTWTVEEEQRVKTKQTLGGIARESGAESSLSAPAVGLAMLKQPTGATVKRGEVLADIIYFEAWAKGVVKGKMPNTSWRCEVISATAQKNADCKISVVSPKSGGFQVTVAVEPRWFDEAADAVVRVAPR